MFVCLFICVHALLWFTRSPPAMALSPLLPRLLENSTYTAQSICEQRHKMLVVIYAFSLPQTFWLHKKAIGDQQPHVVKKMSEWKNVQANPLSRSISANTYDVQWIHWKRIAKTTHYKCTLSVCTFANHIYFPIDRCFLLLLENLWFHQISCLASKTSKKHNRIQVLSSKQWDPE